MRKLVLRLTGLLVGCVLFCCPAWATSLDIVSGILMGATEVSVGGNLYDVQFVDGTCAEVYGVCDVAHFTFKTQSDAEAASTALLSAVFLDGFLGNFDSSPDLTFGCASISECRVITSYGAINATTHLGALAINRRGPTPPDIVGSTNVSSAADTTASPFLVYAVWTPSLLVVSEPWSITLLGFGLLALAMFTRTRKGAR